jgi:hypothetical protein
MIIKEPAELVPGENPLNPRMIVIVIVIVATLNSYVRVLIGTEVCRFWKRASLELVRYFPENAKELRLPLQTTRPHEISLPITRLRLRKVKWVLS